MAQKNNIIAGIRNEAKREAEKDFAADWGHFWKIAGSYIGQYIMAIVGFAADFAVAFSMLYGATRHSFASFLGAGAVCIIIQYGYGGATFRIAKAIKTGKITEGKYMRSAIIAGAFGLCALGASLYLSFNFDAVFRVASEPQAEKELQDEDGVNQYYDDKIATLRTDYETERNALQEKRKGLENQRNSEGEIFWNSRQSIAAIDKKQAPSLRATFEQSLATLETERAQRLQQVIEQNEKVSKKWDAKILQGAMFTRWFNISVNLIRVLLIIGYAIFLLDVYDDEQERSRQAQQSMPMNYMPVSFGTPVTPPVTAQNTVSNSMQQTQPKREAIDFRGVAAQLAKQRAKARAYRSKLRNGIGDTETNRTGLAMAEEEIERLEGILSQQK